MNSLPLNFVNKWLSGEKLSSLVVDLLHFKVLSFLSVTPSTMSTDADSCVEMAINLSHGDHASTAP